MDIHLRSLSKADITQIMLIENAVHVVPWTEDTFYMCLQAGFLGWVLEHEKTIIGFVVVSFQQVECHILNIGVVHAYQRQGLGYQLMQHVLHLAKQKGTQIIYLEVRRSNARAIALYKKMDFQLVGERKDYYPTVAGSEDALIFAKNLV